MSYHKNHCRRAIVIVLLCILPRSFCWIQFLSPPNCNSVRTRVARTRSSLLGLRATSSDSTNPLDDIQDKTIFQRVFYMLDPVSSVAVPDSVVVEERVRFEPDSDPHRRDQGYIQPFGPRALILRDGHVKDGEIGKAFATLDVKEHEPTHGGAGMDTAMDSTIAMLLYLASSPSLFQGRLMELSSGVGISSLLGTLGAGFVSKGGVVVDEPVDDILSIPSGSPWVPADLESLTLTDPDEATLRYIMENAKTLGLSASKVFVDKLDWSVREARPFGTATAGSVASTKEYHNIIAGDVAYSFPEAKMLARAVAYRLEPSYSFVGSSTPAPQFVHLYPDGSDENVYLRKFLERGYRMNVSQGYLQMEKISFAFQTLPQGQPESALDDIPLNVQERKEKAFSTMVAEHSVDYGGDGTGEYFFPIENGQYESSSEQGLVERDWEAN